jgi:two-component sensor histidine kinase
VFCREHLEPIMGHGAERDDVVGTAELVVTELVTNAINAGCSDVVVQIDLHRTYLRVSVEDDAAGQLRVREPSTTNEHGRGLHIVEMLATGWGVDPVQDRKRVWADLAVPAHATFGVPCTLPVTP